jgi:hypothetical protein
LELVDDTTTGGNYLESNAAGAAMFSIDATTGLVRLLRELDYDDPDQPRVYNLKGMNSNVININPIFVQSRPVRRAWQTRRRISEFE